MKRAAFFVFLLTLAGQASARQSTDWSQDDLAWRGTVRFVDLLETLDPLRSWSTDRYTHRIAGNGTGGAHSSGPAVVVDGLPMSFQFMDRTQYELLPLLASDVASLSYSPGWKGLVDGRFADGVVNVTTNRPTGFSIRGSAGLTNETGDPGPAFYSRPGAKNVDRSGPSIGLRMSWANGSWFLQAAFDSDAHHMTDERIEGRIWRTFAGGVKPLISHATPSLRISYSGSRSRFSVWGGRTVKNNFLFDEIAGREWPMKEYRTWGHGLFSTRISTGWRLGASGSINQLETGNLDAHIDLPNDLFIRDMSAESHLAYDSDAFRVLVGGGGRISDLTQTGTLTDLSRRIVHGRTEMDWRLRGRTKLSLRAHANAPASRNIGWASLSYLVDASLALDKPSGGQFSLGMTLRSDVQRDVWSTLDLVEAGVAFDQWAPGVRAPGFHTRAQTIEAHLTSSSYLNSKLLVHIELRGRHLAGLIVPKRSYVRDYSAVMYLSETNFDSGHSGGVLNPSAGLRYTTGQSRFDISYQYLRLIARGDLLFWKHMSGLAAHRLQGSVRITPVDRFHIFARLSMGSRPVWPDYDMTDRGELPAPIQVQLTVSKQLWRDNADVSLTALNMLDRTVILHPAGVDEQMAIRLGLSVRFSDTSPR